MGVAAGNADGKLKVVASIPDLGYMAERIGGDRVDVSTLASGREDLHGVPARPSFIPTLNRADLLLTLGLDAEHAWLPPLAQQSRNLNIMEDHQGWIEAYKGIEVLDIPRIISRTEGEQHPEGNPHFNVGPQCGATMLWNIADALIGEDPENAGFYESNAEEYEQEITALVERLKEDGRALKGVAVVSYHPDVSYIAQFYGMEVVGSLEPKAGLEPTARHLRELAGKAKAAGVKLVIYHQAQSGKLPDEFASRIGAAAVQFANMVGAKKEIRTWAELQEHNLRVLLDALAEAPAGSRAAESES
jgi:ABC-type Zn uptake system ZnuABC Zn-binding protein ZnuA